MVMPSNKAIATAAAKGFGCYGLLMFVWIHSLVIWKWTTEPASTAAAMAETSAATEDVVRQQQLAALDRSIEELSKALKESRERRAIIEQQRLSMQELLEQVQRLQEDEDSTISDSSNKSHAASTQKIKQLLRISDLSTVRNAAQVDNNIQSAIEELQSYTDDPNTDWTLLSEFFRKEHFPAKTMQQAAHDACPRATASDGSPAATAEDVEDVVRVLQETFVSGGKEEHHEATLPVSFPETVTRLERLVHQATGKARAAVREQQKAADLSALDESKCVIHPEKVLPWIDAGLDAIYRRKQVREALLAALKEEWVDERGWPTGDYWDTTGVILDADLSLPDDQQPAKRKRDGTSGRQHVNLRQMLDKPALHECAKYVDKLVDALGGHHHALDQWLDSNAEQLLRSQGHEDTQSHPDDAIGKALVSCLLQAAGKVELPVPRIVHENAAGVWHH